MTTRIAKFLLTLAALLPAAVWAQLPQVAEDHVEASLGAGMTAVVPGSPVWLAVRLKHQDNWHSYWKNPGDAGMPTTIKWELPAGVVAGDIVWPLPRRFDLPADLVDFGYEGDIHLLTRLIVPEEYSADILDIAAEVRWLECEDETCIPNGAALELSLPVALSAEVDTSWQQGIALTLSQQPREGISLDAGFSLVDGHISLVVQATEALFAGASSVSFIPGEHRVFDYLDEQQVSWQAFSLQLSQAWHRSLPERLPDSISGLLIVTGSAGREVYQIDAVAQNIDPALLAGTPPAMDLPQISLGMAFVFALVGGLILNLMPCVLPVLSLKIISVVESAGTSRAEQKQHALVYCAGVVLSFLVLACILLALQASGAAIGWGFHMQSPVFVSILAGLFLVMGLSMSGLLELGTGLMGVGSNLSLQSGYRGSFFTGVLTCVVASPCTAPFMGTALAVAFTQSPLIALVIFASLGLGVALPFLLIAWVPSLAAMMPRPGHWMLTFKKLMALPLYGAVGWMLWVLQRQVGNAGMLAVVVISLLLVISLWLYQRGRMGSVSAYLMAGRLMIVMVVVSALWLSRSPWLDARQAELDYGLAEPFTQARLDALRAAGEPVFVNMTASWCIPCLVNEKVALGSEAFERALQDKGVSYLKGDWTNNDPAITAVLKRYQTSGVPLYLMFPRGGEGQAEVLPQVLTEGILLEALERI